MSLYAPRVAIGKIRVRRLADGRVELDAADEQIVPDIRYVPADPQSVSGSAAARS